MHIYIYIYKIYSISWLCWVFVAARAFSYHGEWGLHCGAWALGTGLQFQHRGFSVWHMQLRCSAACGIFLDKDQTGVPCIARWIFKHCCCCS